MPPPFPGMNPYVEAPQLGSGFRPSLTVELSAALKAALQDYRYSDIRRAAVTVTAAEAPADDAGPGMSFMEVRDVRRGHELFAVIEVLSHTDEQPPGDENRRRYDRQRRDLLNGRVSLVDLDLLRSGNRGVPGETAVAT